MAFSIMALFFAAVFFVGGWYRSTPPTKNTATKNTAHEEHRHINPTTTVLGDCVVHNPLHTRDFQPNS